MVRNFTMKIMTALQNFSVINIIDIRNKKQDKVPDVLFCFIGGINMKTHIVCFGDSNTHGYCADPAGCADHGTRFNEDERWTCLLQKALGEKYLVLEEGLSGRTTSFDDPVGESLSGYKVINPILVSHEPVDLLVIMLGTNDTKERFNALPAVIGRGLEKLVKKAKSVECWGDHAPAILIVSPPWIREELRQNAVVLPEMGESCIEKSRELASVFRGVADLNGCWFMDAEESAEFNQVDGMHLTARGHRMLAEAIAKKVREIFKA